MYVDLRERRRKIYEIAGLSPLPSTPPPQAYVHVSVVPQMVDNVDTTGPYVPQPQQPDGLQLCGYSHQCKQMLRGFCVVWHHYHYRRPPLTTTCQRRPRPVDHFLYHGNSPVNGSIMEACYIIIEYLPAGHHLNSLLYPTCFNRSEKVPKTQMCKQTKSDLV